ncbi:YidC/Oxa1 family membrane protein insertase [Microbacterium sp. cx-55]|uniref:YidC/Oxa1 family membrane protein insertase n=1 Tax=Microbacterium sp. cx-55 TaxID=2875948 RepID=UPI001CBF0E7F|nr:membrane protein insertase YidC [Microbacterium sp. cx-55]MBZ4486583.1 YidC/Oxa1 family membrane protein insertase [Microbacterium sp. cx-55]UGB36449.1 YidC/Oxa1 family membrane protein insertase [Microbacterium sp. cx-55]
MDIFAFPPVTALLDLAYRALLALSSVLEPFTGASAAAAAVILTTLIVRALLIPAGVSQAKAEQTRARLAPRLRLIQQRYRTDPERMQRETMQVYRDEHASPLAGCLPLLVQAPIVGILYAVFLHPVLAGRDNALLSETLAGVPLGSSLAGIVSAGALDPASIAVFGTVLLMIIAAGEVTRRAFRPVVTSDVTPSFALHALGFLSFASAVVAVFVPLAAGLYLAVTVVWTLVQRLVLRRRYPLKSRSS